jgi:hypothetical protein
MKKQLFTCLGFLLILFWGCATSGQKFISINYLGDHEKTHTGKIGIADFTDQRSDMGKGYVGYRVLMDKSQETYMVQGLSLADSFKKAIITYYEKNGYTTSSIKPWALTPKGVSTASQDFNQIMAGKINKFECRATKKGGRTEMTLDIGLTLYQGMVENSTLKTTPVSFTLERTEFTFNQDKLELFVNQALGEVIQKALILE